RVKAILTTSENLGVTTGRWCQRPTIDVFVILGHDEVPDQALVDKLRPGKHLRDRQVSGKPVCGG
ncbi:MAG TPA: hypothetical protein PKO06_17885, partial [Candidatus Ozemobacteraceae bacterium]|nr:hypothetical protein [Candidatus Ozemobacteraceae bacterium]